MAATMRGVSTLAAAAVSAVLLLMPTTAALSVPENEYIGCFKDSRADRVMSNILADDSKMNAAFCREHCEGKGALFYGTQVRGSLLPNRIVPSLFPSLLSPISPIGHGLFYPILTHFGQRPLAWTAEGRLNLVSSCGAARKTCLSLWRPDNIVAIYKGSRGNCPKSQRPYPALSRDYFRLQIRCPSE